MFLPSFDRYKQLVIIGNFGFENLHIGSQQKTYLGGAALRFALTAVFYNEIKIKILTIVGAEQKWKKCLNVLQKQGVDISNIIYEKKSIKFITRYDNNFNLLNFKIKNSDQMNKFQKFQNNLCFRPNTLVHICSLSFAMQKILVLKAKLNKCFVSLQLHFNSINDFTKKSYLQLLKKIDLLFLNQKEALKLTNKNTLIEAGFLLSSLTNGYIFITNGNSRGAIFFKNKRLMEFYPIIITNPHNLEGAGDAFAAGVISGLLNFQQLPRAVNLGVLAATFNIAIESPETILLFLKKTKKYD